MLYQSDYLLRVIEQAGAAIREAFKRFREGAESDEPLELTEQAVGLVVDMDPKLFLRFSPQSMVSFLEISQFDDRLVTKLSEALELQGEILEARGALVEAGVRREQAAALLAAIDPARAN